MNFPKNIPLKLEMNQMELAYSGYKNKKTLAQHRKKYEKTSRFKSVQDEAKQQEITYNNFLHHISVKFNRLAQRLNNSQF